MYSKVKDPEHYFRDHPGMWVEGPWKEEPAYEIGEHDGYRYLIDRKHYGGFLCGYVYLPRGHKWCKLPYWDIAVDVHGGLTYSDQEMRPTSVPKEELRKLDKLEQSWWIGFDCGQTFDLKPLENQFFEFIGSPHCEEIKEMKTENVYRDISYVRNEIYTLIKQCKDVE